MLGVVLMERDAGSVRLTAAGVQLLEHAREVLRSVECFIEAVDEDSLVDGVLRLGVTEMVVHTWLRDFLKRFKQRFPKVLVELTVDLSVNLEKELADRTIDLAFQSGPFKQMTSGSEKLGSYPMIWVASPATGLSANAELNSEDLSKFPILTHARNTRPYEEIVAHFANNSKVKVRVVPSTNLAACLQMTIDGYGVSALLAPMVEKEIAAGQLFQVNYSWLPSSLDFFARFHANKSPAMVAIAAEIAASISNIYSESFAAKVV